MQSLVFLTFFFKSYRRFFSKVMEAKPLGWGKPRRCKGRGKAVIRVANVK